MATKEEIEAINNFREATKGLKKVNSDMQENVGLRTILAKKDAAIQTLEGIIVGNGIRKDILDFARLKLQQRKLRKDLNMSNAEFKALKQAEKQRKKEIAQAKAREAQRKARDAALTATLGEEQAAIRIQALNAQDNAQIIADAQIQAEASKTQDDKEAADAAKKKADEEALAAKEEGQINSLTEAAGTIETSFEKLANSLQTIIGSSGEGGTGGADALAAEQIELMRAEQSGEGESPAERDKAKAEAKAASDKQIDLLQKIADNISGGGAGGGGEGEGSGGGLSGIGKTMASVGKGIGALGKGIGKGVGMALKGLAFGLKAFANPKILAGAGIFAGAIAIIGAGIAAASWILGKALPTFAEGMKSFEEIDGGKLLSAGKGMIAVAAGMAAFGVGAATAGLGSLVGGISSGIASLFGGEDPLEKLAKFQEYNFDEPRISNNAKAMVSYSKGMAALGGASAVSGIGAAVGAIGGAIAGLFGADDPLDKMFEFQKYKFDTARIKSNAEAVSAYAQAMKDFPASPSASIFKAAGDAIIGFLGGETDPFAPMIKFGTRKFNTEGIVTNAKAVKAYAEAIKDFPESPSVSLLTALKNGIIGFLGGETDPFAPMTRFSNMTFNTENIVKNAEAVKAYANAVKDFPESPSVGLFEGFKNAAISFLGGDTNPFTPIKTFGDMTLNIDGIRKNAGAVRAYANAMKGLSIQAPPRSAVAGMRGMAMALGSGNSAGLSAFEKAMNSINGLDASKISLLQGIKIPEITPQTAAEYEKVFNAMKKNQPDLIDKVSSTLSRFFGSSEKSGSGGSGGQPAGSPSASLASASKGAGSADPIESAAKDVSKMSRKQYNNMMVLSKEDAEEYKSLKARQKEGDDSRFVKNKISMLRKKGQATFQEQNPREKRPSIDIDKISTGKRANLQASEIAANPPVAAAAAGGGGGNVSISAPTTNSSQSTSSYPITNRPNNPALDRMRMSLDI